MQPRFAIAAGHALTAEAAAVMLEAGGTAVDGAIAAAFAAMVAEPVLAGLLGGGFLMQREASGATHLRDGFVQTPLRQRPMGELDFREILAEFGTTTQAFHIGTGAIATPGLMPMLAEAHARHGRLPLAELVAPAVKAAREGVVQTAFQAKLARIVAPILQASPGARSLHCDAEGEPLPEGAMLRNPALADVLEVMGHEGPRFVTEGEIAAALIDAAREGGHLTRGDLARYEPAERAPLVEGREAARIHLNPPPSHGGLLMALALRDMPRRADLAARAQAFATAEEARRKAEAAGLPLASLLNLPSRANGPRAHRGTTHISIVTAEGAGAALTLSNGEGCGIVLPGTGIMPNNMLGEADLLPHGFETWEPGIRLASMMAPSVVDWPDGRAALIGSGGSNRIRTAMAQAILNIIDLGMAPEDAVAAPRLHLEAGAEGMAVDFEDILPEQDRAALLRAWPEARAWPERSMFFGGTHLVQREPRGGLSAAADLRRDGAVRLG